MDELDPPGNESADEFAARPWIGVHFDCCGVYQRIYRRPGDAAYRGACPRCCRPLVVPVGPRGTTQRVFRAS